MNWDCDTNEQIFTEKNYKLKDGDGSFEFHLKKKVELDEALSEFWKFADELITDSSKAYLIRWFIWAWVRRAELEKLLKWFPMMYFYGLRWVGKSQLLIFLARILWYPFNVENYIHDIQGSTLFTLITHLSSANYFLFLDEYQWSKERDKDKEECLKWNYWWCPLKRWVSSKDTWLATNFYENKSVLCIAWESITNNEALFSRCIYSELRKWDYKPIDPKKYEEIVSNYNNYFANILLQKKTKDSSLPFLIKEAMKLIDKYGNSFEQWRIKNNLITVIVGNLLLWVQDEEQHKLWIECFLEIYGDMVKKAGVAIQIINDICMNPDRYISLRRNITESESLPLYITSTGLVINAEELVKKFIRYSKEEINSKKTENELLNIIWFDEKKDKRGQNYWKFIGTDRLKWTVMLESNVRKNNNAIRLWNATYNKFQEEIQLIDFEKLGKPNISLKDFYEQMASHKQLEELE